jgi:glycosyltransferase involved in cell wall biosynthesis
MRLPAILFVLPAKGGSGGANSIVQECFGLRAMGVPVAIAVNAANRDAFLASYPELEPAGLPVHGYASPAALAGIGRDGFDVLCATTNTSVGWVAEALKLLGRERPVKGAYYVQDYEPLFYDPESPAWAVAHASYAAIPGAALFAKTEWLCDVVYRNHGLKLTRVAPSIDHAIFFPDLAARRDRVAITAMLRPQTPRRAPHRTVRILAELAASYSSRIELTVFGASPEQLEAARIALPPGVSDLGRLRRDEVPALMRRTDLFLDLSDFQAFGRTGLEGMACGCVPLLPLLGGADEYALDGRNALVVDTRSDDAVLASIARFMTLRPGERDEMRLAGLATAARYSVQRTALDELRLFQRLVG